MYHRWSNYCDVGGLIGSLLSLSSVASSLLFLSSTSTSSPYQCESSVPHFLWPAPPSLVLCLHFVLHSSLTQGKTPSLPPPISLHWWLSYSIASFCTVSFSPSLSHIRSSLPPTTIPLPHPTPSISGLPSLFLPPSLTSGHLPPTTIPLPHPTPSISGLPSPSLSPSLISGPLPPTTIPLPHPTPSISSLPSLFLSPSSFHT